MGVDNTLGMSHQILHGPIAPRLTKCLKKTNITGSESMERGVAYSCEPAEHGSIHQLNNMQASPNYTSDNGNSHCIEQYQNCYKVLKMFG